MVEILEIIMETKKYNNHTFSIDKQENSFILTIDDKELQHDFDTETNAVKYAKHLIDSRNKGE
jgi:hypothetical protein